MKTPCSKTFVASVLLLFAGCAGPQKNAAPTLLTAPLPERPLLAAASAALASEMPAAIPVNHSMKLSWSENDPIELVTSYRVEVLGDLGLESTNAWMNQVTVDRPPVELLSLLTNAPNGVYKASVRAVNSAGLESDPSAPLWIYWYGRPNAPTNLSVTFNLSPPDRSE